ncbi:hypothetical protein AB0O34_35550 [Sphaerisporangium sp. NPDC088356]|uniref:hypothetical protein n=1 Tax=Sphaerisporangium sp. NPDC088356 TaxID=3154871 RepID=UPI0034489780
MNTAPPTDAWEFLGLTTDNWIAVAGGIVALAGVFFGGLYARRSSVSARKAADAGEDAAEAARKSAEEAATISRIERERRHDDLSPPHPGEITAEWDGARNANGTTNMVGSIAMPRDYRVQAWAWNGTALTPVSLPLLLRGNQPQQFHIEQKPRGARAIQTQEMRFRFWPPIACVDDTTAWTCPCDGPTGEDTNGPGHWELRVQVTYAGRPRIHGF